VKSAEERNDPRFFELYATGDRDSALALARSLDFSIIDAMWVVRKAEPGADLGDAREIVLASPAYADLAEDYLRQQDDYWALITEMADEIERDEHGSASAIFHVTPSRYRRLLRKLRRS